jgi:hypothetical protein
VSRFLSRLWDTRVFRFGAVMFALGCGPLLAVIGLAELGLSADPNPNPVGFGIMAFFTFWPSVILMAVGIGICLRGRA